MKNSSTSNILVVGATGFLGMEICRQLTAANKNVSGLVRKTSAEEKMNALKQLGVQLVEGDLKDLGSIKKTLQGITTIISTASSTFSRQDGDSIQTVDNEGQGNLADAAITAGIQQYIYVSFPSMKADFPLQDAKRRVEKKLVASNMPYTILQPTFFAEAWLSPAVGFDFPNAKATIYGEGKNKISWITIRDVAAFAVGAVDNPKAKNRIFELGGPEALSPLEVVALFEKTGGKKFGLQHVPVETLQAQKDAASDDLGKTFASLMLIYAAGQEINMQHTLRDIPVKLNSVSDYAKRVMRLSQPA
ncbi:MAG: NmrA family NAD(P)-binding protein [Cyclobacteriaceae bacterium]|nr:NmrA family NAD(P)-binding protein [Cyclobacteriaceae bacterium]